MVASPAMTSAGVPAELGNFAGAFMRRLPAAKITAKSDAAAAITAAQMINAVVVHTVTTGRTLTTPTGAEITAGWLAEFGAAPSLGDTFVLNVITVGTGADDISTLTAGDGDVTFVGKVAVGPDIADAGPPHGTWLFRSAAGNVWVGYRIG